MSACPGTWCCCICSGTLAQLPCFCSVSGGKPRAWPLCVVQRDACCIPLHRLMQVYDARCHHLTCLRPGCLQALAAQVVHEHTAQLYNRMLFLPCHHRCQCLFGAQRFQARQYPASKSILRAVGEGTHSQSHSRWRCYSCFNA